MGVTDNILSFDMISPKSKALALAKRVKERRLEMNLTQEGLSSRAGIPVATYRRFERSGEISLERLLYIAFALDALGDFDLLFSTPRYANLDDAVKATQQPRKRGKYNE